MCGYNAKPLNVNHHLKWYVNVSLILLIFIIIGATYSQAQLLRLTPEETAWLKEHVDDLVLAPVPNYPPIDYWDEKDRHQGVAADIMRLIEKRLGIRFKRVQLSSWQEIISQARNKMIDIMPCAHQTPERDQFWLFTRSYLDVPSVIVADRKDSETLTLDKLVGKRVAVVQGYALDDYLKQRAPELETISVPDDLTGLTKVSFGECDAMIIDLAAATYLISQSRISNLRVAGETGFQYHYRIASRRDWPILNQILNKALQSISPKKKELIIRNRIGLVREQSYTWIILEVGGTLLGLMIFFFLIWYLMKHWVTRRTLHLELSRADFQSQKEMLDTLLQNSQDVIILLNQDGTRRQIYGAYQALTGRDPELVMGLTGFDTCHPDDLPAFHLAWQKVLSRKSKSVRLEWRLRHANGEWIWVEAVGSNCLDIKGLEGIVLNVRNITERKLIEESLIKKEAQYQYLLDNIHDVVYRTDLNGDLIMISAGFYRLLGYNSSDEILGKNIALSFYVEPDKRNDLLHMIEKNGTVKGYEVALRHKNGSILQIATDSHIYYDESGQPAGVEGIFHDITEEKKAQDLLRLSEEKFSTVFRLSPDTIVLSRLSDSMILDMNDRFLEFSGYSREEVGGKTFVDLGFYPDPSRGKHLKELLVRDEYFQNQEVQVRIASGELRTVLASSRLIDLGGEQLVLGMAHDITERKEAEIRLQESEENLRTTLHSIGDAVIATDREGRITQMNPIAERLTGWRLEESVRRPFSEIFNIVDSDTRQSRESPVERVLQTGNIVGLANHTVLINRDGREFQIADSGAPIRHASGEIIGVVLVFRDITEQYQLAQEALQNAAIFRTIFEVSPYSITIQRFVDGAYVMVNPAFERISGYKAEEVIGRNDIKSILNVDMEQYYAFKRQLEMTGKVENVLTINRHRNGKEMETLLSARMLEFNNDMCVISLIIDMTEIRRMQEQLNQAQKLDAVGHLAGGIAHDFNNMLGGIIGATELLQFNLQDNPELLNLANIIHSAAQRAGELTRKLLAFSRKSKIESTPVDVHQAIEEAVWLLRRSLDKRVVINLTLEADQNTVVGDSTQLMNIFLNLGINAGHAMPEGGTLLFKSRLVELSEAFCHVSPFQLVPGDYILVEVEDSGCGIPAENLSKIFEPFFTTRLQTGGTGLGLSLVYSTVQQHHGAISVYSEEGRGTVFHVYLPLADSSTRITTCPVEVIHGSGRILVIDDEEIVRIMAKAILEHLGYEVVMADNGRNGVDIYKKHVSEIDLVVLDMVMPVMNGRECFQLIRQINPEAKVIISSGFFQDVDVREMLDQGLIGFVRKPYHTAELSRIIAQALTTAPESPPESLS